jgi:isopropylmalate/homocitrate/citramalate synthase
MSRRIEIVEVGPRDGLQNEKSLLEVGQKLEMIRRLEDAAQAIAEDRPAVVEQREEADFRKALSAYRAQAHLVATIKGLDYSDGKKMTLRVYEAATPNGPGAQP